MPARFRYRRRTAFDSATDRPLGRCQPQAVTESGSEDAGDRGCFSVRPRRDPTGSGPAYNGATGISQPCRLGGDAQHAARQVADDINYHLTFPGPPPDQSCNEAMAGAYLAEEKSVHGHVHLSGRRS